MNLFLRNEGKFYKENEFASILENCNCSKDPSSVSESLVELKELDLIEQFYDNGTPIYKLNEVRVGNARHHQANFVDQAPTIYSYKSVPEGCRRCRIGKYL